YRGKIVGRLPASRIQLVAKVVEPALERFEVRIGLAIVVEAKLVEIPEAAIDGEIAAPIARVALERHALARVDLADDIGAGPERRPERGLFEGVGIDGVACEHRHQTEDEG